MAGGTMQRDDFGPLMFSTLTTIFGEELSKVVEGQWKWLFNELTSKRAYETELGLIGMGLPSRKAELEAPRPDSMRLGRPIKYINTTFAQETRLSKEARDDDQYGKLARMWMPEMTKNFGILKDYQGASFFDNGFTYQGYEPDGVALFSTAHPLLNPTTTASTSSNRSATDAALSVSALANARAIGRKTLTESGKKQPIIFTKLVVGPSQQQLAEELVYSPLKPGQFPGGTQPNDINYNYNKFDPMIWDYLDEDANPSAWYLAADKSQLKFKHYLREALNDDFDIDKRVRAFIYLMFTRYSMGFSDWRGTFASRGTG